MSIEAPFPVELTPDEELFQAICTRPSMYVRRPDFDTVCAFLDGFNLGRGDGPLLGLREWLVVRLNGCNNLHWTGLAANVLDFDPTSDGRSDEGRVQALGKLVAEFLRYRNENGITKIYYDYGKWLLRQNWYRGPLRKKRGKSGEG